MNTADTLLNISFVVLPLLEIVTESYGIETTLILPAVLSLVPVAVFLVGKQHPS